MKYAHIIAAVSEERWAIRETTLQTILDFMEDQANGIKYDAAEVEARIGKGREQAVAQQEGGVAILPLRGVIANRMSMFEDISGGMSSEGFGKAFQAAMRDDTIKAIVMDVDSPGGMLSGTAELSSMIFNARGGKPIIAHVNARAASAAYWIASAADEIVVTATGSVGSVGVVGIHDDISGAMEQAGVKKTIISAGKYKTEGHPYGPLSEDAISRMQAKVDAGYEMFIRDLARNRNVSLAAVREGFGEGDMVDAEPAVAEGMADSVGTLDDVLQRLGVTQYAPVATAANSSKRRAFATEREKRALTL